MFDELNTEGYNKTELAKMNEELSEALSQYDVNEMTEDEYQETIKRESERVLNKWCSQNEEEDNNTDYEKLVKAHGGECVKLGNGHTFNPFKDASEEQIDAFLNAYCEPYPESARDAVREKLTKEIEDMRKE